MNILVSFIIHAAGIALGFLLCAVILPPIKTIDEHDSQGEDQILFEYEYVEELENLLDLKDNIESPVDISNVCVLDIIHLNNTVIMYYDPDKAAFCYYTRGDVLYKYLNVACRKYVIQYNCPSLYREEECHTNMPESNETGCGLFIKKVEKPTLEKNINKFILCGSLEDYRKIKPEEKDIDILDYLNLFKS